ncbi:MAG: serine/threonine-protein kinase [Terriglobales bacterium]
MQGVFESSLGGNDSGIETVDTVTAGVSDDDFGRYDILRPLGEGGMGTVYLAEQREPIRRLVALKVVKLGMDTGQVLARFANERQALAMMDHPSIARIFDAGATPKGRPYFVMEYIEGVPLTQYCDRKRMAIGQRLELFLSVCRAVQHAHQKGVIHRDLKPSNVLVMELEENPVPKVIDFGIAKATDQWAVEKTLLTQFGQMVGTPEYASP